MARRDPRSETERVRPTGAIIGGIILGLTASGIAIVSLADDSDEGSGRVAEKTVASAGSSATIDEPGSGSSRDDGDSEPGSLEPVRVKPADVKPPVNLYTKAGFGTGVSARITDIESVQGKARGRGEISGPAIRITVTIANESDREITVPTAVISVMYGKQQAPAISLSNPGVDPLPTVLAAKSTASGKYVFAVPPDERGAVRVSVAYSASVPTLVFKGAVK